MDTREKFIAAMSGQPGAPLPKWEYGYWGGAVREWIQDGLAYASDLPEDLGEGGSVRAEAMGYKKGGYVDQTIHTLLGLDAHQRRVPVDNFIYPRFEEQIVEDQGDSVIVRDGWGVLRQKKKDQSSLERFISGPVRSWQDWEQLKERLQPDTPGRFPDNWETLVKEYQERDYPLVLGGGQGFFGSIRYLLGEIEALTGLIKMPDLVHAINDHLCDLWIGLAEKVLQDIQPDLFLIWEDMCYKNGPLISPDMVGEFMVPYYRRLCAFLVDSGVGIIHVDTDGDAWKILPHLMEGGMTGTFPLEVNANMDAAALRESFPTLQLIGGVDKMALFKGREAIDHELEKRIWPTLQKGGFIPTIDHLVPPGVPWDDFRYYRERLNGMIDRL